MSRLGRSAILLVTLEGVYTQWKTKSTAGVSHWLFVGQLTDSVGSRFTAFCCITELRGLEDRAVDGCSRWPNYFHK
jgi:hypothetical protein